MDRGRVAPRFGLGGLESYLCNRDCPKGLGTSKTRNDYDRKNQDGTKYPNGGQQQSTPQVSLRRVPLATVMLPDRAPTRNRV